MPIRVREFTDARRTDDLGGVIAYAKRRVTNDGRVRYTAGTSTRLDASVRLAPSTPSERPNAPRARRKRHHRRQVDRPTDGKITFRRYVEEQWWPSRHLELHSKAAYRSCLDRHFLPFFGHLPMQAILPSTVQAWVTEAVASGLSPCSVGKYPRDAAQRLQAGPSGPGDPP